MQSQGLRRELGSVMQFSPGASCDGHLMVTEAGGVLQAFLFACVMVDASARAISLQPGPSRRDCQPHLRVASCCVLGFLPEWRLDSKHKHAESKPDGSYSICYDIASKVTQCHMCHIWLVRSESLSLVIIQDY